MSKCEKCEHVQTSQDKWRYTMYIVILFFVIVNPMTYTLVNGYFAGTKGYPSTMGFAVHAIIFGLLLRYMMDLDM
jgi:sorbitol-specific phosphotransferase system component IIC